MDDLTRRALRQELEARTEGETDPAGAMREAVQFAAEVRHFLEDVGGTLAHQIEERHAFTGDLPVVQRAPLPASEVMYAPDGSGDIFPVAIVDKRPK